MTTVDELTFTHSMPEMEEYVALYDSTGWNDTYQLDPERVYDALHHSWFMVAAYDGNDLVGFGRIISDGILHALIVEMIVLPDCKGKGIGSYILNELIAVSKNHGIPDIQLFCAKGQTGFYLKHGFAARPDDAPGMQLVDWKS